MKTLSLNRRTLLQATTLIPGALARTANAQDAAPPAASAPCALGMMVDIVTDRSVLDATIQQIGRPLEIVMFHTHWGAASGIFDSSLLDDVDAHGAIPMITWEAWAPLYARGAGVAAQPDFALGNILSGAFDAYVDRWAQGLAAWGKPVLLRFGHEMNGNWYPWGVGINGNTASQFVDTWRYLHDRFATAGADNVFWVWSPNASIKPVPFADIFPGDDVVDFLGTSGFNWGDTQQAWGVAGWQSFTDIFAATYDVMQELSSKPIVIAETASAELGGDKAAWITNAFLTEIPERFPAIAAVVWFNVRKEVDWRIDSSVPSLRAFVTAANNPRMLGKLVLG